MHADRNDRAPARRLLPALLVATALAGGCSFGEINMRDPLKRSFSLKEAQHHYTELVRWSQFIKASDFVTPELREQFVEDAPSQREVRITDYEVGSIEIDDETGESTVEVTYYAYTMSSPLEIAVVETQRWKRDSVLNDWRVTPSFSGLSAMPFCDEP